MTIKELKEALAELDEKYDNCQVVCQKDSEGNGYSPLYSIDVNAVYIPSSSYDGDVYCTSWSAEDMGMKKKEWEVLKKNSRVLVLTPIS